MNQIRLQNVHLRPTVGVYEEERTAPQDIFIDLLVTHQRPTIEDSIATTLDYDQILNQVDAYIVAHQPYLIETIGEAILDIVFTFATVTEAEVTVRKPAALASGEASIVISRTK